jgi:hypothetical protein
LLDFLPHGALLKTPSYTTCLRLPSTVSDRIAFTGTSLGFLKDLPLYRHQLASPVPERPKSFLRSAAATRPFSSAYRVSHPPDGLLLANLRRLVASCYRLWGSSRFASLERALTKRLPDTRPVMPLIPFKAFPSLAAAPCHQGPCLLDVGSRKCCHSRSPQPQGFALRKKVRCVRQALPPDFCPLLSWALFPSKALPLRVAPNRPP